MERGQAVRHLFLVQACGGSNPPAPAKIKKSCKVSTTSLQDFLVVYHTIYVARHFMINSSHTLYIASNSASRKKLLQQAQIPFQVIDQDADELLISTNQPLPDIVTQIAQLKMKHAKIPHGQHEGQIVFVLTADTLVLTSDNQILAKPVDRQDAISMIRTARKGLITGTGFCLRVLRWQNNEYHVVKEIIDYDQGFAVFNIPDSCIEHYLDKIPFLSVSGAISVEGGFGSQFLQSVNGSYESIIGLPMFKIRNALEECGFYQ